MTRRANARLAGLAFLLYIGAGITLMALGGAGAEGTASKLAHVVLARLNNLSALVLAVTLYSITRDVDNDVALMGLVCRVGEGVLGAASADILIGATFFAVGSTFFSWLLLRGRLIPIQLAWLGVLASLLLLVGIPLQVAGTLHGPLTSLMWLPMAAFEVPLGLWLIFKGSATPR